MSWKVYMCLIIILFEVNKLCIFVIEDGILFGLNNIFSLNKMDTTFDVNGDFIKTLPTNKSQPSYNEQRYIDMLFKDQSQSSIMLVLNELKTILIFISLFILFSIPQTDNLFRDAIPICRTSLYALTIIKAILFAIVLWVINNYWLITVSSGGF